MALEPKCGKLEGMDVLERSGYSLDLIRSMLKDNAPLAEPLQFVRKRTTQLKVDDFIQLTAEGEYTEDNATLGEAVHRLGSWLLI